MDEKDYEIFTVLRGNARLPVSRIADHVGLSGDAVKARIDKLTDDGVLRIIGVVDPRSLGYFSLGTLGLDYRGDIDSLVDELRSLDFVTFVALTLGEQNAICEIAASDDAQLHELATSVIGSIPGVRGMEVWRLVEVVKWHGEGRPKGKQCTDSRRVDGVDTELLRVLVNDPRITFRDLATKVGEPYSLVRRRAQALFDDGAIQASAVLDRSSADAGTSGMIGLSLRGSGITEALQFAVSRPEITIVARTFGRFSATLEVVCGDALGILRLADEISELSAVTQVSTCLYAKSPILPMPWLLGGASEL